MKLTSFFLFFYSTCLFSQNTSVSILQKNDNRPISTTQNKISVVPKKQQWEIGLHNGIIATFGDVDAQPSWTTGIHVRRAIDYVFSLRLEGKVGQTKGEDTNDGAYLTDFRVGTGQLLVSTNSLKWNGEKVRKVNPYLFVGGGFMQFRVNASPRSPSNIIEQEWSFMTLIESGFGIAFRVSDRLNLGIETNITIPFGEKSDLVDGVDRELRDVLNYTNLRINFNIGDKEKSIAPLYWVNPMEAVMRDIDELKNRKEFDPTDNDKDGVFDIVDEELKTPPNAPVDTKGRTLDSDGDGFPDYLDKEPYSVPGYSVDEFGRNNDPKLKFTTEQDVQKMLENALKVQTEATDEAFNSKIELINWVLPMVHFDIDNYQIRLADYGNLANAAKVIDANPMLKFVVEGFTDKTASDFYNNVLSYNRAKAVIEYLVGAHSIQREQLVLKYGGVDEKLVPSTGDNFMNRRVEIRVAKEGDVDMSHPKK